jgi:ArsR family transcriptional regulator
MIDKKKQLKFEKQAEIISGIAHPLRIAVIDFLKDGPHCVCDIAQAVGSERSNVSRHLSVMVGAGLLEYRKEGLKVIYRLKCPCILDFLGCVTGVLRQQAKDTKKLLEVL